MDNTRYSPKRDAILQCLRSTTCHPSAEWVYSQLKPRIPDLSLATVYRNLARFRAEGAVQVIGCVDGEDRYDGDTAPHGHFICRTCGAVIDLPPIPVELPDMTAVGEAAQDFSSDCSRNLSPLTWQTGHSAGGTSPS